MSLASALERAAEALPDAAEGIRPANGDPERLLEGLRPEGASDVALWLLEHELEAGEELLEAWLESERGTKAVLALSEEGLPKPARKVLRRIRHQLRGRGFAVPTAAREPMVARLPRVGDDVEAAAVTPLDPTGACLAYLTVANPSGGVRLFEVALQEERGILDVQVYSAGRGKVRSFLKEVAERSRLPAVPADPAAVRALIARVAEAHPQDRPLPVAFGDWRAELTRGAEEGATPGEQVAASLEAAGPDALAVVAERASQGAFGPWVPLELFDEAARKLRELSESRIIVSGARRREQAEEILAETLGQAFAGAAAGRAARRFRHQAYVERERGETERAAGLLAAAEAFEAGDVMHNPVARALLERPLAGLLAQLEAEEQQAEQESLIVKPGGA